MCFIVGGCDKPSIETKDCNSLGYKEKSCDGVEKIVYDTCVSKGEKFVKCTCNPNYYMLTEKPTNEAAYDIEECTKVDGKKLYRATCKSDYKYSLSEITREDGKTNSMLCETGKTPVADGGICTMLYGDNANANKVLYKDCDCNSSYQYDKQKENGVVVEGFKYEGECTYKYGKKATETRYSSVTCDKSKDYISTNCSGNMKEDKTAFHSAANLTCRTCKAPECPICKSKKACYAKYFDILVKHPLSGDIVLNTTFDVDSNGCWYPKFPSCTDIKLKQDEPYRDYPSTEIPEIINGVVNTTKCIADCEVDPIFGYNTEEQCKENLPSSKTCKQVTYTNKSDVGSNTFTNLGSKTLTCFVKQCKYSTQDSCKSAYSSYFSYHPISNKKINLLKDCAKDTYECWNPVYNTCEDLGMTKREEDSSITYPEIETPVGICMVTCKDWYKGFSNAGTYEECVQAKELGQKCVSLGKVGTTECYYSRELGCTDFFGTGCTEKRDLAIATCEDGIDICLMNCSGNNCCCTAENNGYCEPRATYCEKMVGYICEFRDVDRYYEGKKITMTCDISVDPDTKKPNIPSDVCSGKTYAQTQAYCTKNGYSTNMGHQQNCKDGLYDFCPCNQAYTKCRY